MAGRVFDAQVVLSPADSPLGRLLSQYVCARITRMDNVDIALFDHDWHNTIYYFAMNADEQIYLRYGGRDARGPDSYLDLNSIQVALQHGLELHRLYREGKLPKTEKPAPLFPRQIPPLVERTFAENRCVECHLVGDYRNVYREQQGTLEKLSQMYESPDIRTLGIDLDVPKGLVVKQVTGAVEAAGMKSGDTIAALNGTPVWTFGDLQYRLDKVDRRAGRAAITVDRQGARVALDVKLPPRWWWTDITFRHWTVDPRVYFEARPLSAEEKRAHGLDPDGFAGEVTTIDKLVVDIWKTHQLRPGDIVAAVDGVQRDEIAHTPDLYIRLRKKAGDAMMLDVIHEGQRMQMKLQTHRPSFRK